MSLGTMGQRTEGIKKQAQQLIEQAYYRGFKAGREDMQDWEKDQADRLIEQGRNEAWELAYRLVFNQGNIRDVFDVEALGRIFETYSATEAIEKIREYEERQKQEEDSKIRVGDEVIYHDDKGVVVLVANNGRAISIMSANGGWMIRADNKELVKTGRTFPEIVELLKKMQEGE